jgi:L-cysteate sulfo-lyase
MHLARFPRIKLCHTPTPLEAMPNLTRHLGGPQLYVKRDLTGLGLGGNKVRKLEFLLGEAQKLRADTIITTGATQSNHVRQTAAACAKLGLKCVILLEERVDKMPHEYHTSGNVLLNRLLGAEVSRLPANADIASAMESIAHDLRAQGRNPYLIPVGGSNALGALGYCACAVEILAQANEANLRIDRVVIASGSGGTHDGLVTGLAALNSGIPVLGISVNRPRKQQEELVFQLVKETSQLLGLESSIRRDAVVVNSDYCRTGLWCTDRRNGRRGETNGEAGRDSARPRLHRKSNGGTDGPYSQGQIFEGKERTLRPYRRHSGAVCLRKHFFLTRHPFLSPEE